MATDGFHYITDYWIVLLLLLLFLFLLMLWLVGIAKRNESTYLWLVGIAKHQ